MSRKSRLAAAAAAWSVTRALALFLMMPKAVLSRISPLRPQPHPQPNITCETVQPPFGVQGAGTALPGFEVTCGPNKEPILPIGNKSYIIDDVSLPEGYVTILAGPVHQVCYDGNRKPDETIGTGQMNLQGTPFTFSKRNRLVATGCNYRLMAYFKNMRGQDLLPPSVCFTWCLGSSDTIFNTSCEGVACCQAEILAQGAQAFNLSFVRSKDTNVTLEEDGTCSAAFFLDHDQPVFANFASSDGAGWESPLKDELVLPGDRRMTLEWTVGGSTCDQEDQERNYNNAQLYQYCNNMSVCVDAPSGAGHLCSCLVGYHGNPYLPGGCTDIDECRSSETNNCSIVGFCSNTEGSYTCSCPPNRTGDGYKTGKGCSDSLASGSPSPLQTQDVDVCTDPKRNPCFYSNSCAAQQKAFSCACPSGMSGDGLKNGTGCHKHFPVDIALGVGLALVITITTCALCFCWTMKKREVGRKRAELFRRNGGLLLQQKFSAFTSQDMKSSANIFSAEELKIATDNYSESRILGRGGHGTVYKGILPDKTVVAIKKSMVFDERHVEQFVNEITILSQIDHPNVVKLLGCCLETQVPLLAYEFISNGTLFQYIHNQSMPCSLTWRDCIRIAAETAEAVAYLHSAPSMPIIHRDIKLSNILLDDNYVAKVSDFGTSRSVPFDHTHITTLVQGTIGYLDPEYFQNSQLTEKSDVYSFGVVLAELLTRQKPVCMDRPEELRNLAMYLLMLVSEGRLLEVVEPNILAEAGKEQLHAFAQLSLRCLNLKGEERPTMKEVASVLGELRRSFTEGQTITKENESLKRNNKEEENLPGEARPSTSFHSSEGSTQYGMETGMLASSYMPR